MSLPERQRKILDFIRRFVQENDYPPTIREIGKAVGISSTSVVNYNLSILEKKGHIVRNREISRGLRLTDHASTNVVSIPLLGYIAAGEPIPVPDANFSPFGYETIDLTRDILREQEGIYALKVKGNSMIDALVHDGDIVIMRHQQEANNGEMVAVRLKENNETTLKRFYLEGERVRLQPANPTMEPIYAHPADVEVQGKVVLVIRQLN
ncbi:MAG: transcriptional repressor LexA [Anaerolineae bacterium]